MIWVPIAEARDLDIPAITGVILDELEARLRLEAGLQGPAPVPFYFMHRDVFQREMIG